MVGWDQNAVFLDLGVHAFASGLALVSLLWQKLGHMPGIAAWPCTELWSPMCLPAAAPSWWATLGITVCLESVISRDHGKNCSSILALLAGKTHHPGSCVLVQLFWDGKEPINMSDLGLRYSCFGEVKKGYSFLESSCLPSFLTSQSGLKRGKPGIHCTWKSFQSLLLLFQVSSAFSPVLQPLLMNSVKWWYLAIYRISGAVSK